MTSRASLTTRTHCLRLQQRLGDVVVCSWSGYSASLDPAPASYAVHVQMHWSCSPLKMCFTVPCTFKTSLILHPSIFTYRLKGSTLPWPELSLPPF